MHSKEALISRLPTAAAPGNFEREYKNTPFSLASCAPYSGQFCDLIATGTSLLAVRARFSRFDQIMKAARLNRCLRQRPGSTRHEFSE
jgi:hypothetical protein